MSSLVAETSDADHRQHAALPEELIKEILLRVDPLDSLLTFKTVCKHWYESLSDRKFLFKHVLQNPPQPQLILITQGTSKLDRWKHFLITSDHTTVKKIKFQLLQGIEHRVTLIRIKASCNGLLIIHLVLDMECQLFVHNPFTRQSMQLSFPYSFSVPGSSTYICSLVHDASTAKYKLVMIFEKGSKCNVLTLPSSPHHIENKWRELIRPHEYPIVPFVPQPIILVNDELHWLCTNQWSRLQIEALSVSNEEFSTINCPPLRLNDFSLYGNKNVHLFEQNGLLHLAHLKTKYVLDIWVLDDKVSSLWSILSTTNLSSIKDIGVVHEFGELQAILTLTRSKSEVFIIFGNQLILHNTESGRSMIVYDGRSCLSCIDSALAHVNSTVSWE